MKENQNHSSKRRKIKTNQLVLKTTKSQKQMKEN